MNNKQTTPAVTLGSAMYTVQDYEASYLFFKQQMDAQMHAAGMNPVDMTAEPEKKEGYYGMIASSALQHLLLAATLENLMQEEQLTLDRVSLDNMLAQNEAALGGRDQMDLLLSQLHMDRAQLSRLLLAPEIMVQQLRAAYAKTREAQMKAAFEQKYLRAKHILLKEDAGTSNREAEARALMEQARSGADFDALMKAHGEDPGMEMNPDGYVFPQGQMVQEFYEGTLALEPGAISEPIRTSYGWHIIQRLPLDQACYEAHLQEIQEGYIGTVLDAWLADHKPVMNPDVQQINAETILSAQ